MEICQWFLFCMKTKGILCIACLNLPACTVFLFARKFITESVFYMDIGYDFLLRKCIYYIRKTAKTFTEDFWYF